MKADKSLSAVTKALPSLLRLQETRGFGKSLYKQWGGPRATMKILGKIITEGDGTLANLKNLSKFKVGRVIPNWMIGMWDTFADRTAIVDGDKRYTFGEMKDRVFRLANALQAMGVKPKDRVAAMVQNSAEFLEVFWAASLIGATMPFVNWHLSGDELRDTINLRHPAVFIFDSEYRDEIMRVKDGLEGVGDMVMIGEGEVPAGITPYESLLAAQPATRPDVNFIVALNPYTGGTTGTPKSSNLFDSVGYMMSDLAEPPRADLKDFLQYNLKAFSFLFWYGGTEIFDPVDRNIKSLIVTPMYHAGTIVAWAPHMLMGATGIIMKKFDPERFLELIQKERISWTFVAPTILQRVLALPEEIKGKYDLSSMRALVCAAAPCPPEVKRQINDLFMRQGAPRPVFNEYYGSAETAIITILLPQDYMDNPKRIESVGKARGGDLAIRMVEEDRWAEPGEIGQVMGRTVSTLSLRYPGSEQKLHESIVMIDGKEWFDDGLLGYTDADGFLFLTGRVKEMIISGGVNIYPVEIETAILDHPAVFDCAVVRLPHPDLGEVPIACVQLHEGAEATSDEIVAFLKSEGMKGYKLPARIEFFPELPRHIDGKIIKRELEKLYWTGAETRG
ncbi:MAG: class I adenylate-forming enzyme family protein [Candidatus Geothermincolia bacterium]